jgi:protein O-mannosyl-transferase
VSRPGRLRLALAVAVLICAPLLLYLRVATFGYVQADDTDLIRDNQAFLRDLGRLPEAFTRSYFEVEGQPSARKTYYRPLVTLSFMLDSQAGGAEPAGYHLTNLGIHVAAVLLLFLFLRRLGTGAVPAFLLALAFAVHPANTQTVCWIPGRNDSLMAAFAIASLIGLVGWLRAGGGWALALHLVGFAAALFTKESALALLPLFVLVAALRLPGHEGDRLRAHRPPSRHGHDGRQRRQRHRGHQPDRAHEGTLPRYLRSRAVPGGWAAILVGWYWLRRAALAGGEDGLGVREYATAFVRNAPDLLLYLGKIVLPVNLNVMPGLTPAGAVLGVVSLAALAWLFARYLEPRMRLLIAAWFLLFLAPALLVPGLPAYEHRLYFPLAGVIVGLSQTRLWVGAGRREVWAAAAVAVLVLFAGLATAHAGVFRDRYAYWSNATQGTPYAALAHVNLGQLYEADGDVARAGEQYRQALLKDPLVPGANNNLGVLLARAGDVDEAAVHFALEIERHPANADAHYNLGLAHRLAGRMDEAVPAWERTIAVDPYHLGAYRALADYYRERGDAERVRYLMDRIAAVEAALAR